jgi:hypothetical protein
MLFRHIQLLTEAIYFWIALAPVPQPLGSYVDRTGAFQSHRIWPV